MGIIEREMKKYAKSMLEAYAEKHGMKGEDIEEFLGMYKGKGKKELTVEKKQCEYVTAKGTQCKGYCVKESEGCSRHTKNPTKKWEAVEKVKVAQEEVRELITEVKEAEVTEEEVKEVTCQYILKKGNKEKGQKKGDKCGEVGCKNKRHAKVEESSSSETEGEVCEHVTKKGKVCGKKNCKRHTSEASEGEKEVSDTEEVNGETVFVEEQEGGKVGYIKGEDGSMIPKYVYDNETKEWMEVEEEE